MGGGGCLFFILVSGYRFLYRYSGLRIGIGRGVAMEAKQDVRDDVWAWLVM